MNTAIRLEIPGVMAAIFRGEPFEVTVKYDGKSRTVHGLVNWVTGNEGDGWEAVYHRNRKVLYRNTVFDLDEAVSTASYVAFGEVQS